MIFRIQTRKCTKLFTKNVTEYFAHEQAVCIRPLLRGGGEGSGDEDVVLYTSQQEFEQNHCLECMLQVPVLHCDAFIIQTFMNLCNVTRPLFLYVAKWLTALFQLTVLYASRFLMTTK